MNEMEAIVKEFVVESNENLDRLDRELIELERNPSERETLASIFRTIHSIKGATGFLGFSKLEAVAHAGESLLSRLRDGVLQFTPEITSGLLALVDSTRQILSNIDTTGDEGDGDYSKIIENITCLQAIGCSKETVPITLCDPTGLVNLSTSESKPLQEVVVTEKEKRDQAIDETTQSKAPVVSLGLSQSRVFEPNPQAEVKETSHADRSGGAVRVDVKHLDVLMNLVGELVLTRNEMLQFISGQQDSVLLTTSQRLNFLTTQLQEGIMKTRMQPIDIVWKKFPRVIRDLALQCGKQVCFEMEGKETELDKAVIESIQDPLTHLVRNSIDHGLETPEKRLAAGKPVEGHLWLRAFHEGGNVNIEVADDGAGIDPATIKRKAVERGMITADQARILDDQEAIQLIFLPGFSTAEKVTSLSGRGVGMDVVKTNIQKIGGKVSIQSQPGRGTTLKIRIPLTLAIMPALVISAMGGRYAIPQVSVLELVRLEGDRVRDGIEWIYSAAVYRLRGNLLPLVWLDAELRGEPRNPEKRIEANDALTIAVLQADDCKFGLVIDDVNDTEEIVVKPLAKQLRGTSIFSGATIMGDGRVVLILDVPGLAIHARVVSELQSANPVRNEISLQASSEENWRLLLFAGPDDARMAIPLTRALRLEIFPYSSLERIGDQDVVQHRGEILPLLKVSNLVQERRVRSRGQQRECRAEEAIQVIIYLKDGHHVGLVVDNILDTIEQYPADVRPPSRTGVLASAVIRGRVTEILDLDAIGAYPAFAGLSQRDAEEAEA